MKVTMEELYPVIKEVIDSGGEFSFVTRGTSMMPILRNGIDQIVLISLPEKLKKYDIPLFRRKDGTFVLHRIVGEDENGYILIGDNQVIFEHGIRREQMIAVATAYVRDGVRCDFDSPRYRRYCRTLGVRRVAKRIRLFLGKIKANILGKNQSSS